MPTRDYDPINDIIEAIGANRIWPITKVTTDTKGNITIGPGSADDYITTKTSSISTRNPEPVLTTKKEPVDPFAIRSVLSNRRKNAFTVVWEDGTTTVVHCQSGDEWDDEKALAMCFTKKALGNKGNFNDKFNDALDNKMKVIKSEKKVVEEEIGIWKETFNTGYANISYGVSTIADRVDEVEKRVDNVEKTVDDIKTDIKKVGTAAETASDSFSKLVGVLAGASGSTPDPFEDVAKYKVYLYNLYSTDKSLLAEGKKLIELPKFLSAEQKKRIRYPGYTRYWSDKTGLYLDYGSHSYYFFVPGLTTEEYSRALNNSN